MENQIISINLVPNMSTPAVVNVSQYDVGRPLVFKVYDGTSPADLTGVTAVIEGTKRSGLGFSESGTVTDNTVTLNTTLAMTQEAGMIHAEIRFSKTGEDVGTANFILAVEPSPHLEGTTDGTAETMADLQSQLDALDERVEALEGGGGGLTQTEKSLILELFSKAAYAEDDAGDAYDTLEAMWTTTTRTITYNLSHVSSSNTTASIEQGQSYTTTLTASTDYTLNTVTVTMGGVDITSTAYSSGTVSIPSVTGNIVITATAVLAAQSITATYTQSGTVYDTDSLDSLKADLVVTANYSGGSSETVPASDYTLSGTLAVGTSTVTVSYAGLTDTFGVTVTANPLPSNYTAYDYIYKSTAGNPTPIVTDAQLTSDYSVEMEFMIPSGTSSYAVPILGTRSQQYGGTKQIALFITQTTGKLGYWYAGTDTATDINITNDVVHTIKILPVGKSTTYPSNVVIDVDGTEYNTTSTVTGQTWAAWFGIFGYAYSATEGSGGAQCYMQIGEITVKDSNGDMVYDFVPVVRSDDSKNGFYETVNAKFYEATDMTAANWV